MQNCYNLAANCHKNKNFFTQNAPELKSGGAGAQRQVSGESQSSVGARIQFRNGGACAQGAPAQGAELIICLRGIHIIAIFMRGTA